MYFNLASLVCTAFWFVALSSLKAHAVVSTAPCPRNAPGGYLVETPYLRSSYTYLDVHLTFLTALNSYEQSLFCYMMDDGVHQSPTLLLNPGDKLVLTLLNMYPGDGDFNASQVNTTYFPVCGSNLRTSSSQNIHFHGLHGRPVCHEDEVISTLINYQQSFTYQITIPMNQNPGLYYYHPHIHGNSERSVQGGATGAVIVSGIENVKPQVLGLYQQVLVFRDIVLPDQVANNPAYANFTDKPTYDLSLNYTPIPYPYYPTVKLEMKPGEKQFWRIVNACSDTMMTLQILYDGIPQTFEIIGLDGTPTPANNPNNFVKMYYFSPADRLEIIMTGPSLNVKVAQLVTQNFATGPDGDADPFRPLLTITTKLDAARPQIQMPLLQSLSSILAPAPTTKSVAQLMAIPAAAKRTLVFSEIQPTTFYITVDGQVPKVFSRSNAPAIQATQGTVEDWLVQNLSNETHVFHIHQIHFLVIAINGVPLPQANMSFADVWQIPYGQSVTLRMDFTEDNIQGKFVYHCHILGHEDLGMMAVLQINPPSNAASVTNLKGHSMHLRRNLLDSTVSTDSASAFSSFNLLGLVGIVSLAAFALYKATGIVG